MNNVETFSSLTKEKKEAAMLLSIGTFLEYFDLMLYVHMAVFLNELFFPKSDPYTSALISAFAFCSTYALRPFGALLFGYIGDNIGRKITVILTTLLMAFSCFIMAIIPTYAQIGIASAWIITLCRALQGITSMGEAMGAQLYLIETLKPPIRYPATAFVTFCSVVGTIVALFTAFMVTSFNLNWRFAFILGCVIASVGVAARTGLRETTDFIDAKRRIKKITEKSEVDPNLLKHSIVWQQKTNIKNLVALFLIQLVWPVCSYFVFIYCGNILRTSFGYSAAQIIRENLYISIVNLFVIIFLSICSYKIYPLKIVKKWLIPLFYILILAIPFWMQHYNTAFDLFLIRLLIIVLHPVDYLVSPISYVHIPVFKRFTSVSLAFAISHSLGYVISSFAMVYLIKIFNYWGLVIMLFPIVTGFTWAVSHFEKLEQAALSANTPHNQSQAL